MRIRDSTNQVTAPEVQCGSPISTPRAFVALLGSGTTVVAAAKWGRNSIGMEVDPHYFDMAVKRVANNSNSLFGTLEVNTYTQAASPKPKRA